MRVCKTFAQGIHAHEEQAFRAEQDRLMLIHRREQEVHQIIMHEEREQSRQFHENMLREKANSEHAMQSALLDLHKQNRDLQAALASERGSRPATRPQSMKSTPKSEPEYFDIFDPSDVPAFPRFSGPSSSSNAIPVLNFTATATHTATATAVAGGNPKRDPTPPRKPSPRPPTGYGGGGSSGGRGGGGGPPPGPPPGLGFLCAAAFQLAFLSKRLFTLSSMSSSDIGSNFAVLICPPMISATARQMTQYLTAKSRKGL